MATLSVYTDSHKKNFAMQEQLYSKFYTPRLQNYSNILKDIENARGKRIKCFMGESEERNKQLINSSNIKDFTSLTIIRVRQSNLLASEMPGKEYKDQHKYFFFWVCSQYDFSLNTWHPQVTVSLNPTDESRYFYARKQKLEGV